MQQSLVALLDFVVGGWVEWGVVCVVGVVKARTREIQKDLIHAVLSVLSHASKPRWSIKWKLYLPSVFFLLCLLQQCKTFKIMKHTHKSGSLSLPLSEEKKKIVT